MLNQKAMETKEAEWGKRMIEVKIRFWTNDLAEGQGRILPKHAWASGVVRMAANKSHGIEPQSPVPFNSLMDLSEKIEKVLIQNGVTLHVSKRMTKYFDIV